MAHLADIDSGETVTGCGQVSGNWYSTPAAKIEYRTACGDAPAQLLEPGPVFGVAAVLLVVALRQRVIPAPDYLSRVFSAHAAAPYPRTLRQPS